MSGMTGKKHSIETRKKMSLSRVGHKHSEETRRKISISNSSVRLGMKFTQEHCENISKGKREEKAYQWKGDNVGYRSLHKWVQKYKGTPDVCEHCQESGLKGRQIHWANVSGEYKRILEDWIRLCVKCHKTYDKTK